jgi:hypothetical protein
MICDECKNDPDTCDRCIEDCEELATQEAAECAYDARREAGS